MVRSPRATLAGAIANARGRSIWRSSIVTISAACSVGFLLTRVGQLAALDQQVRQLESFGAVVTDDDVCGASRAGVPYRPAISAAVILIGWPVLLAGAGGRAAVLRQSNRQTASATFAQVLTIVVHASAIFAVRALVAAPVNYARESLGGATSLSMVLPGVRRIDVSGPSVRRGRHFRRCGGSCSLRWD